MFIGREQELQFLNDKYNEKKGQLIIYYGRRRVGKTETLRQFCKDKPHVFFSCRECTDKLQLKNFSEKMLKERIPAAQYINEFLDWDQAFTSVLELPYGESKKILVIDEFPYMCKGNVSIPSILQNLWDEKLKDANVMIILCGSAMSFIEKEILAEKNPLYGRATGIYKMKEMDFYDAIRFFPHYSVEDKVLVYAVLGGIPHYLKQFDPEKSVEENIKKNILTRGCALYSEIEFMLRQELRETPLYNSIIEAVALGNTKLGEINDKVMIGNTAKASVYLKNLIELGIIQREFSVTDGSKEHAKGNKGIYRLTDNFFRFWYAFVFHNYSELESGDVEGVYQYEIAPKLQEYASIAFEEVCKEFMRKQQKIGKLPFRYEKMGRWWGKVAFTDKNGEKRSEETEIDILAMSVKQKAYIIGECKYKGHPFEYAEYQDMRKKEVAGDDTSIYYYLFSKSGFDEKIIKEADKDECIYLYSLDDIVE